ncbi:Molybdenum cofactor sulfurase [Geodia barretti]|uniref:Molybdenum cofactor sulfurase n=1 Tax=Geodia barretti TaxID=519541 RepID=A0AA35QZ80_GEOBA|nr:Molybdenum cofactor sulfurase [Geodia barretti]
MDEKTRREEFPQLKGVTYLDHAGAALYAKSQVEAHTAGLTANLYGNPHSQSPSSQSSTAAVDHVRDLVLLFFGTDSDHYDVRLHFRLHGSSETAQRVFPLVCPPPSPTSQQLTL